MNLLLFCLKIFFARILDVSIGTTKTILLVKGKRNIATCLAFVEISIWFYIVREALQTEIESIFIVIAYAGGYATGTYIGSWLSEKFIDGTYSIQVFTDIEDDKLVTALRQEGFAVSIIDCKGIDETKKRYMLFLEIEKSRLNTAKSLIKKYDNKAFIVINETKYVQNGFFKKV